MRLIRERAVVDRQTHHEGDRAQDDRVNLRRRQPPAAGRAVNHGDADYRQARDGAEQEPVEMQIQASFQHQWALRDTLRIGGGRTNAGRGFPSFLLKYVSRMCFAIGVEFPLAPECSMNTTPAISGLSLGAKKTNHP